MLKLEREHKRGIVQGRIKHMRQERGASAVKGYTRGQGKGEGRASKNMVLKNSIRKPGIL